MAELRINFGVSEFLRAWIRTQPNVVGIFESSDTHIVITHNMTAQQLNTFRSNFINRLAEDI